MENVIAIMVAIVVTLRVVLRKVKGVENALSMGAVIVVRLTDVLNQA